MKLTCVYAFQDEVLGPNNPKSDVSFVCVSREGLKIVSGGFQVDEYEGKYYVNGGCVCTGMPKSGFGEQENYESDRWMNCRDWCVEDFISKLVKNIDEDLWITNFIEL